MTPFEDLVARASADPHVVGLILTGSQARDMATEHSDHDVFVVVQSFTEGWSEPAVHTPELDTIPYLLEWLSDTSQKWSRWQFRGARVLLDRTDGAVLAGLCDDVIEAWAPQELALLPDRRDNTRSGRNPQVPVLVVEAAD
jgi:hypothetical protein